MNWPPSATSFTQSRYLVGLIRGIKLSAGIQSLPPQKRGILLTSKKNVVPGWSVKGRWMSSALRKPSFLLVVAISVWPSSRTAVRVYKGCSPYRLGNHSFGFSILKVAVAWPSLTSTVFERACLPSKEQSNLTFEAGPSMSVFAITSADLRDSSTFVVK